MDFLLSTPPIPSEFGNKLWDLHPMVYFLTLTSILLTTALVWTQIQLRKAEGDKSKAYKDLADAAQELEKFINRVEQNRREDTKELIQDAKETTAILAGLSKVLERLVEDQDRNTAEIRNEIRRESEDTRKHVTSSSHTYRKPERDI